MSEGGGLVYADIIILALVAGFIILRLRGMLGKHGNLPGQPHITPKKSNATKANGQDPDLRIVDADFEEVETKEDQKAAEEEEETLLAKSSRSLAKQFQEIKQQDPSFRVRDFLQGASAAFEMIVEAFVAQDRKTLKPLLSKEIMSEFSAEIDRRKQEKLSVDMTLVSLDSAEVVEAKLNGSLVQLTVRFVSQQVNVVRDENGEVIEGNPNDIDVIEDRWTFEHDMKSGNPNWVLIATDDDADDA